MSCISGPTPALPPYTALLGGRRRGSEGRDGVDLHHHQERMMNGRLR